MCCLQMPVNLPAVATPFPTPEPGSPANGAMLAWCSMAAYVKWESLRALIRDWLNDRVRFIHAWQFRHRTRADPLNWLQPIQALRTLLNRQVPNIDTGAFLMTVESPAKSYALVLTFTGSEPLESVDWLTNLIGVVPPLVDHPDAPDAQHPDWLFGFFHRC